MEVKTDTGGSFNAAGMGTTSLGIIGTVLGGLATVMAGHNGLLGFGGNSNCSANDSNTYVTKSESEMLQRLAAKDSEISLLKSESNTEQKMIDVYKQAHSEIAALRDIVYANKDAQTAWNSQQMVNNSIMSSSIASNANSIASLQATVGAITKTVVPKDVVCPEYMLRYNSWTTPTTPAATTGA